MKVREVIEIAGWIDGCGKSYETTYSDKIVELAADTPEEIEMFFDWDFWEKQERPDGEDLEIVVKYFEETADIETDEPIALFRTFESEISA